VNTTALPSDQATPAMLDRRAVAQLLHCSTRHIDRLTKAGELPQPVYVGRLPRWSRRAIMDWIERGGCPSTRGAMP
jgi:excisionase family DNA binding protein